MKISIAGFSVMVGLFVGFLLFNMVASYNAIKTVQEVQASEVQTVQPYQYVISEVNGDEINGLAITNKSDSNGGIVLSKSIDKVDLKYGDIVEVTYGEEFDEILEVKIIN